MTDSCNNCNANCKNDILLDTLNQVDFAELERKILFLYNNDHLPITRDELENILIKLKTIQQSYESNVPAQLNNGDENDEYFESLLKEYTKLGEEDFTKSNNFRRQEIREEFKNNNIEIVEDGYLTWLAFYDT
jgi:hypothetical protein